MASKLLLEAIDADVARVYLLSEDGTSLTSWSDGQHLVEIVANSFVGISALTEEPIILEPDDQRLMLCHWPHESIPLSSALLCRVTDRQGEVMGVVEILNRHRKPPSSGMYDGHLFVGGFSDDDISQLESIEDQIVAILQLIRLINDRSTFEAPNISTNSNQLSSPAPKQRR